MNRGGFPIRDMLQRGGTSGRSPRAVWAWLRRSGGSGGAVGAEKGWIVEVRRISQAAVGMLDGGDVAGDTFGRRPDAGDEARWAHGISMLSVPHILR